MAEKKAAEIFDESAILTFLSETKEGVYGVVSTPASHLRKVEARREETSEPVYYYSFR